MKHLATFDLTSYPSLLVSSPDGERVLVQESGASDDPGRFVVLRAADLTVEREIPIAPILADLRLTVSPRIAVEPHGRWFAVGAGDRLGIVGLCDRLGEGLVTRTVHERHVHQVRWVPGGGAFDHLCAFLEHERAVHFEPSDGLAPWEVKANQIAAGPGTIVAWGRGILAAYDIREHRERYRLQGDLGLVAVLADGRALVQTYGPRGAPTEILVLEHDGSRSPTRIPATAHEVAVSPGGALAFACHTGAALYRLHDQRCVLAGYLSAHRLAWLGETRLLAIHKRCPDLLKDPSREVYTLALIDVAGYLDRGPQIPPAPPAKRKKEKPDPATFSPLRRKAEEAALALKTRGIKPAHVKADSGFDPTFVLNAPPELLELVAACPRFEVAWAEKRVAKPFRASFVVVRKAPPGQHFFLLEAGWLGHGATIYDSGWGTNIDLGIPLQIDVSGVTMPREAFWREHRPFLHYDGSWYAAKIDQLDVELFRSDRAMARWTPEPRAPAALIDDALAWLACGGAPA